MIAISQIILKVESQMLKTDNKDKHFAPCQTRLLLLFFLILIF